LQQGAIENAASMGAYMIQSFKTKLEGLDVQVNGKGLMIGIQLPKPCAELVAQRVTKKSFYLTSLPIV
jgi:acetylornithine/N-succinyldiaminopimelate aminotransferase